MKRLYVTLSILALGLAFAPAPAHAQAMRRGQTSPSGQPGQSGQAESRSDRNFFKLASASGQFEVQLGQLGQEKATNAQVKQLASHLINEHNQANDQLKSLAQQSNVQLSTQIPEAKQRRIEHLRSLSGDQFDKAFVQEVITEHRKDINLYQRESQQGTDTAVKNFAQSSLSTLQQHLQMAEQVQSVVGTSEKQSQGSKWRQGRQQQGGSAQPSKSRY